MKARKRIVLDSNTLVSRLPVPSSVPAQAVRKALREADILMSEATIAESVEVLGRKKFDPYVSLEDRQELIRLLVKIVDIVPIGSAVTACRDPKDNKILEVAVNGEADLIILEPAVGSRKSAQPLHAPREFENPLLTHKVTTRFSHSLCT